MRVLLTTILFLLSAAPVISGPPEPKAPPPIPELEIEKAEMESLRLELEKEKALGDIRIKEILDQLNKGEEISELSIAGDSIVLIFTNDSVLVLSNLEKDRIRTGGKDVFHVGGNFVVDEDEVIYGDIVSAFGDVTVKGTVEGGVLTLSGNIYVTSTGSIREGAFAVSGKVKKEPGARIKTVIWDAPYPIEKPGYGDDNPMKVMGAVLLLIYIIWMILSATCASIFKKNISVVMSAMKSNSVTSYFKGYLFYILAFLAFLVLAITLIGLPVAVLAVPIITVAGMILSFVAASIIIGQRLLRADDLSFKTYIYGSMAMGAVPGLFFLTLALTGSIVIMVFGWIFVFLLLSAILPTGLGAIISTRFGIKPQALAEKPAPSQTTA